MITTPILKNLPLPVIGAPLFIASCPDLVIEQCKGGIVGAFPALNARPADQLDVWLTRIKKELSEWQNSHPQERVAPFAVNQIVHKTNERLEHDIEVCLKHKVPVWITSLRAPPRELLDAVHSYGGVVFSDIISVRHAQKAIEAGVDGLILVCTGAGGHAGGLSPFALLSEIRQFWNGMIGLAGAITRGEHVLAAQAMGADFAYIGTRWLATNEANTSADYRNAIVESNANDIIYTNLFTGVLGNYLRKSIVNAGLDPDNLPVSDPSKMSFSSGSAKAWRDIWGAGQGVGQIDRVLPTAEVIAKIKAEYHTARTQLNAIAST